MAAKVSILCPRCDKDFLVTFPQIKRHQKSTTPISCPCGFEIPISQAIDQLAATAMEGLKENGGEIQCEFGLSSHVFLLAAVVGA